MIDFKEAERLLEDHRPFNTNVQIDHIILDRVGGRTAWGRYCQALREIRNRVRFLQEQAIDFDELESEIAKWSGWRRVVWPKKADLALRRLRLKRASMESARDDTEREYKRFLCHAMALKEGLGEIGEEKRHMMDMEARMEYLLVQSALEFIAYGRPQLNTLAEIASLPLRERKLIVDFMFGKDEGGVGTVQGNRLLEHLFQIDMDKPQLEEAIA